MIVFNKKVAIQLCIAILFFFIAFIINRLPHNSFVAGGDFYQLINPSEHFSRYFYEWLNQFGQGSFNTLSPAFPFYSIAALLDYLGFASETIAGFQMFFVLYLSYLGFYFSIKIIFPNLKNNIRIGGSLLYALNSFTLTLFVYPWGFTHHILFYIFIPPLLSLFIRIFSKKEFVLRDLVLFALFFLLSTISYNNIAFFAVLLFAQLLIFLMFFALRKIKLDKILLKKIIVFALIYLIGAIYFLLPFYLANSDYQNRLMHTAVYGVDLFAIVKNTSNSILNVFQLDINGFNSQPSLLNLLYPLILFFLIFKDSKNNRRSLILIISTALFCVFLFFAVRIHEPFVFLNSLFYKTTFFALFRSPDKIFILLPFFYGMLLVGLLQQLRLKKIFIYLIFFVLLLAPYKFYTGGVIDTLRNINFGSTEGYYNYVVQIPDEYYQVRRIINKENSNQSIISLPYAVGNSLNWSNYPKWHFLGQDVLYLLYNKNYISANTFDHPMLETQFSFKDFNEKKGSPEELLSLIKKFSGQFIFFHKDIVADWTAESLPTENALEKLKKSHQLDLVASNKYFDLYEVKKENLVPLINSDTAEFFKKINPSKYRVILHLDQKENIIFNQSHNAQWKLYLAPHPLAPWCKSSETFVQNNPQGRGGTECQNTQKFFEGEELSYLYKKPIFDDTHKLVNQYANQWTIDPEFIKQNFSKDYYKENSDGSIDIELVIYFNPQSYFYLGLILSGTALLGCLGYLGYGLARRRKRKNKELKKVEESAIEG